jgi:hypothetical protein
LHRFFPNFILAAEAEGEPGGLPPVAVGHVLACQAKHGCMKLDLGDPKCCVATP